MNFEQPLIANEDIKTETAVATLPKLQHGVEHLRSRVILAATSWNSNVGQRNKVEILISKLMQTQWSKIVADVEADINSDIADGAEVIWKPISHFLSDIYKGQNTPVIVEGKTFAAILTSGEYAYINVRESNFYVIGADEEQVIGATKVIMLRETSVKTDGIVQTVTADDSEFVRTVAPTSVARPRHTLKEAAEQRANEKAIATRRKANKAAKKQRSKSRK